MTPEQTTQLFAFLLGAIALVISLGSALVGRVNSNTKKIDAGIEITRLKQALEKEREGSDLESRTLINTTLNDYRLENNRLREEALQATLAYTDVVQKLNTRLSESQEAARKEQDDFKQIRFAFRRQQKDNFEKIKMLTEKVDLLQKQFDESEKRYQQLQTDNGALIATQLQTISEQLATIEDLKKKLEAC